MGFPIPYHGLTSGMIYESYDGVEITILEGRLPEESNEIVIGNIYRKELGVEIGDYITLQLDSNTRKDLLIVGTYQGFYSLGRGVKMKGSTLEDNNVEMEYKQCSITLKDGVDLNGFIDRMREVYGDEVKVVNRKNLYESIMEVICDPQKAALQPFAILIIFIGVLNAFYIIYSSNVGVRI